MRWLLLALLGVTPVLAFTQSTGLVPAWSLVWADEFEGPEGSAPDPQRWAFDLGGGGWGNNELQTYTDRRENSRIEGGHLILEARQERFTGSDGRTRDYTSARLKTLGLASWTYGRIEARIQVPSGNGLWPAFWMLGTNFPVVGWPASGEIDILENLGREPRTIHGTVHGPGFSGAQGITRSHMLREPVADAFHVFAVEWTTNRLRWLVDETPFFVVTPHQVPAGGWVFDRPYFLLLNVAVGGNWPGPPDVTTRFPQQMRVDYIRVYAPTNAPVPRLDLRPAEPAMEARWPSTFPHAVLHWAPALAGPWGRWPQVPRRETDAFVAQVDPGFLRLR